MSVCLSVCVWLRHAHQGRRRAMAWHIYRGDSRRQMAAWAYIGMWTQHARNDSARISVSVRRCTCAGRERRGGGCKHMQHSMPHMHRAASNVTHMHSHAPPHLQRHICQHQRARRDKSPYTTSHPVACMHVARMCGYHTSAPRACCRCARTATACVWRHITTPSTTQHVQQQHKHTHVCCCLRLVLSCRSPSSSLCLCPSLCPSLLSLCLCLCLSLSLSLSLSAA